MSPVHDFRFAGFWRAAQGELQPVERSTVRCPGCSMEVEVDEAAERGRQDDGAPVTCPTCGAGFDRDGNLRHEPAIGP